MSSKQTQIALDFGQEPSAQPVPPAGGNGDEAVRPYLAAGGVGVRVKSFKQPMQAVAPAALPDEMPVRPVVKVVNGELFGMAPVEPVVEMAPAKVEAAVVEISAPVETPAEVIAEAAEPGPEAEVVVEAPVVEAEPEVSAEVPADVSADVFRRRRTPAGRTAPKGPSKRGRKSLKEVAAEASLIEIPTDEVLFSKQYYTMGEVSEMFRVNQSLLRFWETEFDILQPKKNKKGDRYFRPVDIKNLHLIYHLLRQKKYTIEGAKDFLKKNKKAEERFEVIQRLQQIKAFLLEWKAQL